MSRKMPPELKPFVFSFGNMLFNPRQWATPRNASTVTRSVAHLLAKATPYNRPRIPAGGNDATLINNFTYHSVFQRMDKRRN